MIRTAAIVILGICLLGAAGWGAFATYQLQETEHKVASLEVENTEVKQANIYISNLFNDAESENRRLSDQVTDLNNQVIEQEREQERMIETAEQYFNQLQSELEAATFELGKDMPVKPTETRWFDCDDSALYMFYYFTNMGYEVDIVKGNLELTGEWRLGCDHIWVIVHSKGAVYPYDWGEYCPDPQHHEYYKIGFTELILAAGIG